MSGAGVLKGGGPAAVGGTGLSARALRARPTAHLPAAAPRSALDRLFGAMPSDCATPIVCGRCAVAAPAGSRRSAPFRPPPPAPRAPWAGLHSSPALCPPFLQTKGRGRRSENPAARAFPSVEPALLADPQHHEPQAGGQSGSPGPEGSQPE